MTEKTLHDAVHEHLEYLKGQGKSERTLYTYSKDLEQVEAFFGPDKKLSAILIPHVSGFLKSDALLKMHGDKDRVIPFAMGRALFERIGGSKQFVTIHGGDHNDVAPPDANAYWSAVDRFVDQSLAARVATASSH